MAARPSALASDSASRRTLELRRKHPCPQRQRYDTTAHLSRQLRISVVLQISVTPVAPASVDGAFFAVSDREGDYRVRNVPPGRYLLEARHRKLGLEQQTVEVKNGDVRVDFTFEPNSKALVHQAHPATQHS
jgi:hypothetical protein